MSRAEPFDRRRSPSAASNAIEFSDPDLLALMRAGMVAAGTAEIINLPVPDSAVDELTAAAGELIANSAAEGTRKGRRSHLRQWAKWCRPYGCDPAEFDPIWVMRHLTAMAAAFENGELARDEDGRHIAGSLRPATLEGRLSAFNWAASVHGRPRPGDDPRVVELMRAVFGGSSR